jgi:hypothetical protein
MVGQVEPRRVAHDGRDSIRGVLFYRAVLSPSVHLIDESLALELDVFAGVEAFVRNFDLQLFRLGSSSFDGSCQGTCNHKNIISCNAIIEKLSVFEITDLPVSKVELVSLS